MPKDDKKKEKKEREDDLYQFNPVLEKEINGRWG